jgi:hypothetical protein
MIYTAPCVRFLMCADRLHGEVGGLALEIESFVGPCEIARADRRVLFGAHKTRDFQRQPPHFPMLSICTHHKPYAQGHINHWCIGGFMNTRIP